MVSASSPLVKIKHQTRGEECVWRGVGLGLGLGVGGVIRDLVEQEETEQDTSKNSTSVGISSALCCPLLGAVPNWWP